MSRVLLWIALIVLVGGIWSFRSRLAPTGNDPADSAPAEQEVSSAEVRRGSLTRDHEFSADIGFGDPWSLQAMRTGVITWVPDVDQRLQTSDVAWRIDNEPTIILPGSIPAYRSMSVNSDDGSDIRQLEEALIALGYGPDEWTANDDFDSTTKDAVEDFEADNGQNDDGIVQLGSVLFVDEAFNVTETAVPGQRAESEPVIVATSIAAELTAIVTTDQVRLFVQHKDVTVEYLDGTESPVVLAHSEPIGRDDNNDLHYLITFDLPGDVEPEPATLHLKQLVAEDELLVPADTLVALAEGGYAVEVITGDTTTLRAVDIVDSVDEMVAISGDLEVGDELVIP